MRHESDIRGEHACDVTHSGGESARSLRIVVVGPGGTVHVVTRARYLAELGYDVTLVSHEPVDGCTDGMRVIAPYDDQPGVWGALRRAGNVYRKLRRIDADVFFVHFAWGVSAWLAWVADCRPVAVNVMGSDLLVSGGQRRSRMQRWVTQQLIAGADLVTAKSDHLLREAYRSGIRRDRCVKVTWGVDMERFSRSPAKAAEMRDELGLSPEVRVILSPRGLRSFYNIKVIVEAMSSIVQQCPQAVLLLTEYGADAEYRHMLEQRIDELGLQGYIRFVGRVSPERMPGLFSLANVSVSLAPSDGLPQAMFESLACETPLVLSPVPSYAEVVNDGVEVLIRPIDPDSVAEAVLALLTDEAMSARMGRAGRQAVERSGVLQRELLIVDRRLRELVDHPCERSARRLGLCGRMMRLVTVLIAGLQDRGLLPHRL